LFEVCDNASRLDRRRHLALLLEPLLDGELCFAEGGLDVTAGKLGIEREVGAEFVVEDGRALLHRLFHVGDGREILVANLDALGTVLGGGAAGRQDDSYGFADMSHLVDRQHRIGGDLLVRHEPDAGTHRPLDVVGQVLTGKHGHHAIGFFRAGGVDPANAGMCLGAPDDMHVQHAR
jgi:hypothetical protein